MNSYLSPLRYPGGKGKLSRLIESVYNLNCNRRGSYIEPYAGGSAIAFYLLFNNICRHIHLNDLNYPLYCFWSALKADSDSICRKISNCKISINAWKRHKLILKNAYEHDPIDTGFSFFFLNRVNRSGIIKRGSVIGGLHQTGRWRMDARFNKKELITRIAKISNFADRISVYNLDALNFINTKLPDITENSLIYIDPPYYNKGQRLYDNFYEHSDHEKLAKSISKLKRNWLVTYDDTQEINGLFKGYRKCKYRLNYSASAATEGNEVMFFSNRILVPSRPDLGKLIKVA